MGICAITIVAFQNCGRVAVTDAASTLNAKADPYVNISEIALITAVNEPIDMKITNAVEGTVVSLNQTSSVTEEDISNGRVKIDLANKKLTFTPGHGFRGSTRFTLYSTYLNIINVQNITVVVQNPTLSFNPALAVRGAECITCHANIKGDMISDFGWKSEGDSGPDLFGTAPGNWLSMYAVAHSGSASLSSATIDGKLIVPKAEFAKLDPNVTRVWFPSIPTAATPTLKDYISAFASPTNSEFQGIFDYKTVYIGAPKASDIISAGQLTANAPQVYYKNSSDSAELSGFARVRSGSFDYYGNSDGVPMVCEGDLLVDGVVFLNNLTIETVQGCRIYATRSVFINGPITYKNARALSNIEITSAVGVYMGFGFCVDCSGSNVNGNNYGYQGWNTLVSRWNLIIADGAAGSFRNSPAATLIAASIADFAMVSNTPAMPPAPGAGVDKKAYYKNYFASQKATLLDATNSFVGADTTSYNRLLLNAPVVMSRYSGNFEGTVIAEFAMWRLGDFQFTFDPVFTGVPLFPFLKLDTIIKVSQ